MFTRLSCRCVCQWVNFSSIHATRDKFSYPAVWSDFSITFPESSVVCKKCCLFQVNTKNNLNESILPWNKILYEKTSTPAVFLRVRFTALIYVFLYRQFSRTFWINGRLLTQKYPNLLSNQLYKQSHVVITNMYCVIILWKQKCFLFENRLGRDNFSLSVL